MERSRTGVALPELMAAKPRIALASALCLLGWLFIFGLFADAADRAGSDPGIYIITGRAGGVTGANVLEIDDGGREWACPLGAGVRLPEAGSLVMAYCLAAPDGSLTIFRIDYLLSPESFLTEYTSSTACPQHSSPSTTRTRLTACAPHTWPHW